MHAETMSSANLTFKKSIQPTNNVVFFTDRLVSFNRKIKYNINRSLNNGNARVKYFRRATSKDMRKRILKLHHTDITLQNNSFEVTVIHIAISDIANNKNPLKCKIYGI